MIHIRACPPCKCRNRRDRNTRKQNSLHMCTSSNLRCNYNLGNNKDRTQERSADPDSTYIQDKGSSKPAKELAPKN
jgi:hypothetical protein